MATTFCLKLRRRSDRWECVVKLQKCPADSYHGSDAERVEPFEHRKATLSEANLSTTCK
jgi:hypothetical protein